MKITAVRLYTMNIPLITPFKTALRTVNAIENLVVAVETDEGAVGYGEAPPTAVITGDTIPSIAGAIKYFIAPKLIGRQVDCFDELHDVIESSMVHNTSAKAAIEIALYDLVGKRWNVPLYKLLGGAKQQLETDITISVNPVDEMVRDAVTAAQRGFRILKVKVGNDVKLDVERLTAIKAAIPAGSVIRVDANQGWTPRQAVRIIKTLEDAGLDADLVEQPVKAHDIEGMRYVTANVDTPILADESVFSAADAIEIIRTHAADLVNIKLMKTGGIWPALKICDIAELYGVECMIGCMLESRLSVAAAAHLAAARGIITRADLDGPSLCAADPFTGGPNFDEATITMSDDPGIGVSSIPCSSWS